MMLIFLESTTFGLNFSFNFSETSSASSFVDSEIPFSCSSGMIRECPLLRGLISRMAMLESFSAIL